MLEEEAEAAEMLEGLVHQLVIVVVMAQQEAMAEVEVVAAKAIKAAVAAALVALD